MALDEGKILRHMKAIDKHSGRSDFWKPDQKGRYKIRIIPGWRGSKDLFVADAAHWKVGPENNTIKCPRLTFLLNSEDEGGAKAPACLVCDYELWLATSPDADDNRVAAHLRKNLSPKFLFNVYLESDDAVVVWSAAKQAYGDLMGEAQRYKEQHGNLTEIFELGPKGYFFELTVAPNTRDWYEVRRYDTPSPVGDDRLIERCDKEAVDLTRFTKPMDEKDVEDIIGYSAKKIRADLEAEEGAAPALAPAPDPAPAEDRGSRGAEDRGGRGGRDDDRGGRSRGRDDTPPAEERSPRGEDAPDRIPPVHDNDDPPPSRGREDRGGDREERGGGRGRGDISPDDKINMLKPGGASEDRSSRRRR